MEIDYKIILEKAVELIKLHGWCQNKAENSRGEICAAQAIGRSIKTIYSTPYRGEIFVHLKKMIGEDIVKYNDAPNRTREEVVCKLKELAEKC